MDDYEKQRLRSLCEQVAALISEAERLRARVAELEARIGHVAWLWCAGILRTELDGRGEDARRWLESLGPGEPAWESVRAALRGGKGE